MITLFQKELHLDLRTPALLQTKEGSQLHYEPGKLFSKIKWTADKRKLTL